MKERIRAFVAIELPADIRAELERVTQEIQNARVSGVRWVRPEGIHLTLKFLGNIPGESVGPVSQALGRCAATRAPFELHLGNLGAFPNPRAPRVIWIGLEGALEALLDLQRAVEDELEGLEFPRERRDFSPHLTLGRVREGIPPAQKKRLGEMIADAHLDIQGQMLVAELSLMRSTLMPSGAVYARLHSAPLGSST
ncbi:MAG: RNA 2',3'-cyclic phosphodiesterase [Chloroflexi bacterium]|nr:RNA 2',3'-cyclic phosphodiesterase [Chloroflexota bacterium]